MWISQSFALFLSISTWYLEPKEKGNPKLCRQEGPLSFWKQLSFQFPALLTVVSSFQQLPALSATSPPLLVTFSGILSSWRHHRWCHHPPRGQTLPVVSSSDPSCAGDSLCTFCSACWCVGDISSCSCHRRTHLIVLSPNLSSFCSSDHCLHTPYFGFLFLPLFVSQGYWFFLYQLQGCPKS